MRALCILQFVLFGVNCALAYSHPNAITLGCLAITFFTACHGLVMLCKTSQP